MTAPAPILNHLRVLLSPPSADSSSSRVLCVSFELSAPPDIDPYKTPSLTSSGLPDGDITVDFPSSMFPSLEAGGWEPMSARSDASGAYHSLTRERTGNTEPNSAASLSASSATFRPPFSSRDPIPEEDGDDELNERRVEIQSPEESEPPTATQPTYPDYRDPLPTGPLSTARLLEFENGPRFKDVLGPTAEAEDLAEFFSTRPIVQAPTQITPDSSSPGNKTEVLFLLSASTPVPEYIKVLFTPTWRMPGDPPKVLVEVEKEQFVEQKGLHRAWAEKRMEDLVVLQEIARELEAEGARGVGMGRVKVGVEGGGMDEEAVRREGWMVGEEMEWVREKFLEAPSPSSQPNHNLSNNAKAGSSATQAMEMDLLGGLGISAGGLKLQTNAEIVAPSPGDEESRTDDDDVKEDLFALPLSPRSPDMASSPFSMWRGGEKREGSKLRLVETMESLEKSEQNEERGAERSMLTPPREVQS